MPRASRWEFVVKFSQSNTIATFREAINVKFQLRAAAQWPCRHYPHWGRNESGSERRLRSVTAGGPSKKDTANRATLLECQMIPDIPSRRTQRPARAFKGQCIIPECGTTSNITSAHLHLFWMHVTDDAAINEWVKVLSNEERSYLPYAGYQIHELLQRE